MLNPTHFINSYGNKVDSVKSRPGRFIAMLLAVVLSSTSCAEQESAGNKTGPQRQEINANIVTLNTSMGDIRIELDAEKAPVTVDNFLKYANEGHYNGTIFHRVIQNFMIQGGGFEPGMLKKGTNAPITNEANNGLKNNTYTIAMARTGDPHSATAQFFINVKDNDSLNHSSETRPGWGYAVFGKVVSGTDVVDAIEKVATTSRAGHRDVPVDDVVIESVQVGPHP